MRYTNRHFTYLLTYYLASLPIALQLAESHSPVFHALYLPESFCVWSNLLIMMLFCSQNWKVFVDVPELIILVPPLLGLKGNLEMTLASRLSTQVIDCSTLVTFLHSHSIVICFQLRSFAIVLKPANFHLF